MDRDARSRLFAVALLAAAGVVVSSTLPVARADTILLKNGTAIRGTLDQDNTLAFVYDNLKRTFFYNSKISKVESDAGFSKLERFALVQPLDVHVGTQPPAAVNIQATPWDSNGRRNFRYVNNRQQVVSMQQAINEIGPQLVRFRGIDGFWQGQVATSQVPRPVILGLLGKVMQTDLDERLKVTRWLIQAEWYAEALDALDALPKDFPNDTGLRDQVADTRRLVVELQARKVLEAAATRRKANQPNEVAALLRSLPTKGLPQDILDEVRDQVRQDEALLAADHPLVDSLRELAEKLPEAERKVWKGRLAEVLEVFHQAPDAARPRLEALSRADVTLPPEVRFAKALSGWVMGPDASVDSLASAGEFWRSRSIVRDYLASKSETVRATLLGDLQKVPGLDLDKVAKLVVRMDPPLSDPDPSKEKPGEVTLHRVVEDDNPVPTEYAVLLPPEYHPSRSYPAVLALHDGRGPKAAIEWLAPEASRRGYVVIAPEYNLPGQGTAYHFSTAEHAAAELALRDARKRYAIDSDRVYLAGQLEGGNMALDFGLGHPDLFAGVVSISGFPFRYAYKYKAQADHLPLYVALGELSPVAREVAFDQYFKPMILDVQDVTYVDYLKRGLEAIPEEVPVFFDWMGRHRREPVPKAFEVATARSSDARFYGVVVREIAAGRSTAPEAADAFGKNLRPATIKMRSSVQGNSITLTTSGINRLDVWVSPKLIDFGKKMEVKLNEKPLFRGVAKLEYEPMLEDLRNRGDRQQLYYWKVAMGQNPRAKGR